MDDGATGESFESLAKRASLISILSPLVRIAAVAWALFTFLGISLAGGGNMFVPHVPGLTLIIIALVPAILVNKSLVIYVATVVVALVGSVVSVYFAVSYSEPAWLVDVVLFFLFILGLTLVRRRSTRTPKMQSV